ncbi:MAG: GGDEF domain-containing protein [Gammaproteobacteria bacterium]|nr:GGDEF domain-containing protein [Gammaproteobacteria bacterium]
MNDRVPSLEDLGLPLFLQGLSGVAIALLDENSRVLAANRDFLQLAPPPKTPGRIWNVSTLFVNPRLKDVRALVPYHGGALLLYRGILNVALDGQPHRSLQGHIYRWQQNHLLVAAEHNVAGLEMLGATVMQINESLAETRCRSLSTNRESTHYEAPIWELMQTDPLTGVSNRQRLHEVLEAEIDRSQRHDRSLCLLITGLDHFKDVNDHHGHDTGDEVLRRFSALLCQCCRQSDLVARLSGEEFAVLLPDTLLENAVAYGEHIRHRLESQSLVESIERITASFGVAMRASDESSGDLLRRADHALYRSKKEGRNRVTQSVATGQNAVPDIGCC